MLRMSWVSAPMTFRNSFTCFLAALDACRMAEIVQSASLKHTTSSAFIKKNRHTFDWKKIVHVVNGSDWINCQAAFYMMRLGSKNVYMRQSLIDSLWRVSINQETLNSRRHTMADNGWCLTMGGSGGVVPFCFGSESPPWWSRWTVGIKWR